jgi:hypothetical protein
MSNDAGQAQTLDAQPVTNLTQMWDALSRYQPYADADGHGESWRVMCEERTYKAAVTAGLVAQAKRSAAYAEAAVWAAAAAAETAWPDRAIYIIEQALKERA